MTVLVLYIAHTTSHAGRLTTAIFQDRSGTLTRNDHTFSVMLRNNLRESGNKGAVEIARSFPLYKKLKGYVQYFSGYGQSILDYNDSANSIGVGLALSDIL
jgi:phospholipase A1